MDLLKEMKLERTDLQKIYLLTGPNDYLIEKFIQNVQKKIFLDQRPNVTKIEENEEQALSKLSQAMKTVSLWGSDALIVFEAKTVLKGKRKGNYEEEFLKIISEDSPVNLIIVAQENIDKRTKAYKKTIQQAKVLEASNLQSRDLQRWITQKVQRQGKTIDQKAAFLLEYSFHNQMHFLDVELAKIITYVGEQDNITLDDVTAIIASDRFLHDKIIFEWSDLLAQRKVGKVIDLMGELIKNGSAPAYIFVMLLRQIRLLALTFELKQQGQNHQKIAKKLKEHPFPIKKIYDIVDDFSFEELNFLWINAYEVAKRSVSGELDWRENIELLLFKWQHKFL